MERLPCVMERLPCVMERLPCVMERLPRAAYGGCAAHQQLNELKEIERLVATVNDALVVCISLIRLGHQGVDPCHPERLVRDLAVERQVRHLSLLHGEHVCRRVASLRAAAALSDRGGLP
jgi:hypothetical protein